MSLRTLSYCKSAFLSVQGGQGIPGQSSLTEDASFPYVNLLLHGDAANNANNSTVLDSSTNNFTVTRSGAPAQGTFSPYSQTGWSAYFTNPDYLSTPAALSSAIVGLAGNTWTMEAWVKPTTINNGGVHPIIGCYQAVAANGRWVFSYNGISSTQAVAQFIYTTSSSSENVITTSATISINQWSHLAITIDATTSSSSTIKIYVNGVGQTFTSQNLSSQTTNYSAPLIGGGLYTYYLYGNISNLRLVKNNIVYTSSFIVPTTPLSSVSGTLLLTLQSNRFVDNSGNGYAITVSQGLPYIQPVSPFEPTSAWQASVNGGSVYFNGSTDYLSIADNAVFALGTNNFTIEAWVYPTSRAAYAPIITKTAATNATSDWALVILPTTGSLHAEALSGSGYVGQCFSPSAIPLNTWTHVAWVRSGSTFTLYVNGTSVATATSATGAGNGTAQAVRLGWDNGYSGGYFPGYITNARVVNGSAVYTANFTPPSSPLTAVTNTALLLLGTNSAIYDSSTRSNLIVSGDTKTMIAISKFGSSSINFDGTGDYISMPYTTNLFDWWTSDYTLELWVYASSFSGWSYTESGMEKCVTIGNNAYNSTTNYWSFGPAANGLVRLYYFNGSANQITSTVACNLSQWNHIAFTKTNAGVVIWVNGIGSTVTAISGTPQSGAATPLTIGAGNAAYINGYLDDVRITKGVARYTSNFTVPSAPFPNY